LLETTISRCPIRRKMYGLYVAKTRFWRSFTTMYPCQHTHNIGLTWCKSHDGWQPMQQAAMWNRIHLVQNEQVGCYPCHFDLKLTIYSSGLPTSFHYLLSQDFPLCFIIIISSLPQPQIMAPQATQPGESGTESSRTTAVSSGTPPGETQLHHRQHLVRRDAAKAATENMTLDARLKIVRKTGSSKNRKQGTIGCKCSRIMVHGSELMI